VSSGLDAEEEPLVKNERHWRSFSSVAQISIWPAPQLGARRTASHYRGFSFLPGAVVIGNSWAGSPGREGVVEPGAICAVWNSHASWR